MSLFRQTLHFVAVSRKYFMADQIKKPLTKKIPEFIAQVRQEMRKVTWPTGKETRITTIVVFIFAIIAAGYFMIVDQIIYRLLHLIIG
jgi:preprotein translocase subunit SecE